MKSRLYKNPYGRPGKGNYDKLWEAIKCKEHKAHTLKIIDGDATVIHHHKPI